MTYIVGLTGQTGAGKTTVSNTLRERGVPVVDADILARDVVNNSKICLGDLVLAFGCDIIDHNGELNRKRLSAVVFGDKAKLKRLNAITFPHIIQRIEEAVSGYRAQNVPLLVLDAPTLYEAGADRMCGSVIAVIAPQEERLHRIMQRDGLSDQEALARIRAQHTDEFFHAHADFVVENTGTVQDLIGKVDAILHKLLPGGKRANEAAHV